MIELDIRIMGGPFTTEQEPHSFFPVNPSKLVLNLNLGHDMAILPTEGENVTLAYDGPVGGERAIYKQLQDTIEIETVSAGNNYPEKRGRFVLRVPPSFRSLSVVANDPLLTVQAGDVRPSIVEMEIAAAREVSVSGRHILIDAAQPDSKPLDVTIVQSPYNLAFEADTATNSYILAGRGSYMMTRHGQSLFAVVGRRATIDQVGGLIKQGQVYAKQANHNGVRLSNEDLCPDISVAAYGSDKEMRARGQEVRDLFMDAVRRDVDPNYGMTPKAIYF